PTNTANVWVANYTGVHIEEITKRTLPYQVCVATLACVAVVALSPRLFGVRAFAAGLQPAAAATIPSAGLFVPAQAANSIAVGDDGSADGRRAAGDAARQLSTGEVRAFLLQTNPDMGDCSRKRYAAYAAFSSTRFTLVEGTDVDIGLKLMDCGGWEVGEWHEHGVYAGPQPADVDALTDRSVARLREWSRENPQRWSHLLSSGLAYADGDPPAYYYALYKTVDGNMPAYVRGGGPAYDAGMRTNDIVNKLDGRFWWEYGTYQTQARAYDGKPHSFEVQRGTTTLQIQLGAPFPS
ncbi:MAG: hypothetical protein JOY59_08100, partial [Candidatus Eremiobacteraeota bacterium]|nr:hypothetical protein [Candidatus Eremiobacteraeota bacterium]